jgi:hypothetical protein
MKSPLLWIDAVGAVLSNWKNWLSDILLLRPWMRVAVGVSEGSFGIVLMKCPLTGCGAFNALVACCPSGVSLNWVESC